MLSHPTLSTIKGSLFMKHQLLALADEKFLATDFLGAAQAIHKYMKLFVTDEEPTPTASKLLTDDTAQRLHLKNEIDE